MVMVMKVIRLYGYKGSNVVYSTKISARPLGFTGRPISLRNRIPKMLCIFLTAGCVS